MPSTTAMKTQTPRAAVPPALLDVQAAGIYLGGVSRRALYKLIERGKLKPARIGIKRCLFRRADLDKLVRR